MTGCAHQWQPTGTVRPHHHEPNSRRQYFTAVYHRCERCGWLGFRFQYPWPRKQSKVMYTWNPDEREWDID